MGNNKELKSKLFLLASMSIFGTIGVFRRYIPFPSGMISLCRAIIGTIFLLGFIFFKKSKPDFVAIRKNLKLLIIAGIMLGFNWILLFESYRYTTVATATGSAVTPRPTLASGAYSSTLGSYTTTYNNTYGSYTK